MIVKQDVQVKLTLMLNFTTITIPSFIEQVLRHFCCELAT